MINKTVVVKMLLLNPTSNPVTVAGLRDITIAVTYII